MVRQYEVKGLLDMSSAIENAPYVIQTKLGQGQHYSVGSSKCGSASSASQSQSGNSRAYSKSREGTSSLREGMLERKFS